HSIRQIDTAHAYVYQLHTELLHGGACPAQQVRGDRGTLCGHDLLDGESRDHALDAVLDDLAEPACCVFLYAARAPIERADISDAPLHVEIDVENLAFTREEALGREILRDDAPLELADGIDERHPQMQSRLVLSLQDLAEARADGELRLSDGGKRTRHEHDDRHKEHCDRCHAAHQRSPRARGSTVMVSVGASDGRATPGANSAAASLEPPLSISLSSGR